MRVRTLHDRMIPIHPNGITEWRDHVPKLIQNIKFASAIDLLKHDAPLNAQIFDAVEYDTFIVEKVLFQSLPGFYVCGNLYRPKDVNKQYPAVLNPHGHWEYGRFDMNPLAMLPVRYANLAMRGMVVFAYDMVGWGDSNQVEHNYVNREYERWNFSRFSLQTNNSIKALDFIESLPYVDKERIGCTGCSGGGTQTYFLTALDSRIKVAAPINMTSTIMQGGCNCENAPFLRVKYNNVDYTMLTVPRPLFMSGSDGDWTVNSPQVEFPAIEYIYSLFGAKERYEHFYQHAPHCYNLPTRELVYDFLCRNFGIPNPFEHEIPVRIDCASLRIQDIRSYVPTDGYIDTEEKLFSMVKGIMRKNLDSLSYVDRRILQEQVYLMDQQFDVDIPYTIDEDSIILGKCPDTPDECSVEFYHCYNYAQDAKRVRALIAMLTENTDKVITASWKSAALLQRAYHFIMTGNISITDPVNDEVFIPGEALI